MKTPSFETTDGEVKWLLSPAGEKEKSTKNIAYILDYSRRIFSDNHLESGLALEELRRWIECMDLKVKDGRENHNPTPPSVKFFVRRIPAHPTISLNNCKDESDLGGHGP